MKLKELLARLSGLTAKDADTPVYLGGAVPREIRTATMRSVNRTRVLVLEAEVEPLLETGEEKKPEEKKPEEKKPRQGEQPQQGRADAEPLLEVEQPQQARDEGGKPPPGEAW